jgi:hypothetical protein
VRIKRASPLAAFSDMPGHHRTQTGPAPPRLRPGPERSRIQRTSAKALAGFDRDQRYMNCDPISPPPLPLQATVSPIGPLSRLYQCPTMAAELPARHTRPSRTKDEGRAWRLREMTPPCGTAAHAKNAHGTLLFLLPRPGPEHEIPDFCPWRGGSGSERGRAPFWLGQVPGRC